MTVPYTKTTPTSSNGRYKVVAWLAVPAGGEGAPIDLAQLADRSVQVSGVFDNASCVIKGSINGVDYITLTDPQGNALAFNSGSIEAVSELVVFIKPVVVGGGELTALDISLLLKE